MLVCQLAKVEQLEIRTRLTASLKEEGYSAEELFQWVEVGMNSKVCDLPIEIHKRGDSL